MTDPGPGWWCTWCGETHPSTHEYWRHPLAVSGSLLASLIRPTPDTPIPDVVTFRDHPRRLESWLNVPLAEYMDPDVRALRSECDRVFAQLLRCQKELAKRTRGGRDD